MPNDYNVNNYFDRDNNLNLVGEIKTGAGQSLKTVHVTVKIDDISTAGTIYVVPGVAGTIEKITSVINGAIATADATLTPKINESPITDGAITIANAGSAAGQIDTSSPSAAKTITANDAVEIETDGASTNTVSAVITLQINLI